MYKATREHKVHHPTPSISHSLVTRTLFDELNTQGITLRVAAQKLVTNPVSVNRWKMGRSSMNIAQAERFAKMLGGHIVFIKDND